MKVKTEINILGIRLGLDLGGAPSPQSKRAEPGQLAPEDAYVYGHYDLSGRLIYVGKGVGKRAWSEERHPYWKRYVEKRLQGKYVVKIIADGMSNAEAEEEEARLIASAGDSLVNMMNFGRNTDFQALERFHSLRNANRALLEEARSLERSDPEGAVAKYLVAIENVAHYAFIEAEGGLLGDLIMEERKEEGFSGELVALDRLTLCLIKLGRAAEAEEHANAYCERYKADAQLVMAQAIHKRIEKAIAKRENSTGKEHPK